MARSRMSSAYSPCPTQRWRYLESPEMGSENDSEGVSRTIPKPDGNSSPQLTSVSIPKVLDLPSPILKLNVDQVNFKCKITIKHLLKDVVNTVTNALQDHPNGIEWFKKSQFGHLFDITDHIKITLIPLWMLLSRAVVTQKKFEMWFVLNGIPIRYSLMEHALISGLNCSAYPEDPCHTGDEFRERIFRGMKKISQNDVKKYLEGMVIPPEENESNRRRRTNEIREREKERSILINDKLKLDVLYFLCAVLHGPEKPHQKIDYNLFKMIEDLDWCANYPWGRKTYQYLITQVQKLDIGTKYKDAREKLTRWNCHAFILPLMLLPFECIPVLTPTYAEIREDVQGSVPRICRWKTKFHQQQAPPLDQILHAVGDSTNINSILVPTLEEQKANHMIGFVPYHDDSDVIVDNWATILKSGRSIFWEDLLYADIEGRRNFLNGGTERVQGRDRENLEDIIHKQHTSQEGVTAAEQTRYLPSNPTVNESILPQASSHADNSMVLRELQVLKQTIVKMSTDHESQFLQLERLITENGNRVDMLTNIMSRFVQQQSKTWKGGDQGESSGGRCENSRCVDVRINADGDIEAQDNIYAPKYVGFRTEISVERDIEDSPLNEIFYQTPTCSSDTDCEEDILDVGQQKRRPQRYL
ncbi:hypothetical protein TIFTF001_015214 [Ficus carica]|uniref:DUF1985 domain-containing protein n=1 Tax=Ficus carica TaxID=3494 RepID=A0AA88D4X4_FICCA|nr:hypothetical protein TIFTF001_015214 [Ficus carica]